MVEELKRLNDLYREIVILEDEILDIKRAQLSVSELECSKMSGIFEDKLEDIKSISNVNVKSREKSINEKKVEFRSLMEDSFGIKVDFDGTHVYCTREKVSDSALKEYKGFLSDYIKEFNSSGLSEEDFVRVKSLADDVLARSLKIAKFLKLIKQSKCDFGGYQLLVSRLSLHLEEYKSIIWSYRELLGHLTFNGEIPFSESNIKYILSTTSLMPLVFANNTYPLIRRVNSLNRNFLCHFHDEKTPSMRVSLDRNFFKCFGCGFKGNQIDYLIRFYNISYAEAVYLLAEIFLIDLPGNPYREGDKMALANRYREILVSDEYNLFLMDSMERVCKVNPDKKELYLKLFNQIERVKAGTWDSSFEFEQKSKKYINISRDRSAVKRLLPEENFEGMLPF